MALPDDVRLNPHQRLKLLAMDLPPSPIGVVVRNPSYNRRRINVRSIHHRTSTNQVSLLEYLALFLTALPSLPCLLPCLPDTMYLGDVHAWYRSADMPEHLPLSAYRTRHSMRVIESANPRQSYSKQLQFLAFSVIFCDSWLSRAPLEHVTFAYATGSHREWTYSSLVLAKTTIPSTTP